MNRIAKKISRFFLFVFVAASALFSGFLFAVAYQPPTALPPGGNVTPPVNTGGTTQTKTGVLGVQSLTATGGIVANGSAVLGPNANQQVVINPNSSNNILIQGTASGAGTLRILNNNAVLLQPTAGVVGIRTVSPNGSYALHVGNAQVRFDSNLFMGGSIAASGTITLGPLLGSSLVLLPNSISNGGAVVQSQGAPLSIVGQGAPARLLLQPTGGNVGIGTASPSTRLEVVGAGGSNRDLIVNGRIQTGDAGGVGGVWLDSANTGFVGNYPSAGTIGFWTNGVGWNAFQIVKATGNVGIGTSAPTQKLDVIGYVRGSSGLCIGGDCRNVWPSASPPPPPGPRIVYGGLNADGTVRVNGSGDWNCTAGNCKIGTGVYQINFNTSFGQLPGAAATAHGASGGPNAVVNEGFGNIFVYTSNSSGAADDRDISFIVTGN